MATWMQSQTGTVPDAQYALLCRTLLGELSEAELEERYVSLARAILAVETERGNAA